ncbi:hypothetical protein Tco_1057994 [Tanacetum coccineum]|uniref:Uncharacterized protein n=1 Tax=Tanacetum coccineum TaxID=301880 RepID=A0ABQ5H8S8_9ASTR
MTPYTGYPDVQGIIYQDELSRNRLMRTDELHKFNYDGIPKETWTMFLNFMEMIEVVGIGLSNPMIQPEPKGSTQGYPLVRVEVLRICKDGDEVPDSKLESQDSKPTSSYPTDKT